MTNPFREGQPSSVDDAIGSIRVASTLIAQFKAMAYREELSIEDLELHIRQAQEIYPSIWQHLDDARRVLVAANRDVAAFDEIRSLELGHLGVTGVETEQKLEVSAALRLRYTATKSAAFNLEGIERASRAAHALMQALPEVDWAGLARAENRQIAAAGSLRKGRWLAIAKVVAASTVVLVIAIVVRHVAMSAAPAKPEKSAPQPMEIAVATEQAAARERVARVEELTRRFKLTCDPALRPELARLLGAAGRPAAAESIKTTPCAREIPSCDPFIASIKRRLMGRYAFGERVLDFACRGIVIANAAGEPAAAFAVSITGRGGGKAVVTYRGVTSTDGETDLVAFELAPAPQAVGVGDLDGDLRDELVAVGGARLIVTRIAGDHFIDVDGPALPEGCRADVSIETRPGNDARASTLVITVDDPRPRAGCPPKGRQLYRLAGDALQRAE